MALSIRKMNLAKESDRELVVLSQNGDKNAFGALYVRHLEFVENLTRRVQLGDRSDVIQETFLAAFLTIKRLRKPASFKSWLWGIAMNVCRQRWRERKRANEYRFLLDSIEELPDEEYSLEDQIETREHLQMLRDAMDGLSEKLRVSALQYYFEYLSVGEIAKLQSVSESAVKTRLHRARNILRMELSPTREHERKEGRMTEVEILDVIGDEQVVFLDRARIRVFSVYMQKQQAVSIAVSVGKLNPPRPMTFAFFGDLLRKAKVEVERVVITGLIEGTFLATVRLKDGAEVDARPSDAVNLAIVLGVPIYAEEEVFEKAGFDLPIAGEAEVEFEPRGIQAIVEEIQKNTRMKSKEHLVNYIMSLRTK